MTAGYMSPEPRAEFYRHVDAANVDLKGFTGDFYHRVCLATLDPVLVIERDWYRLGAWRLTGDGRCLNCGTRMPGVFDGPPGTWGPRRLPVRLAPPARPGQD